MICPHYSSRSIGRSTGQLGAEGINLLTYLLTAYNHHRHTTVSSSASRRSSTPAPTSRGPTAVRLRAFHAVTLATGSLNAGPRLVSILPWPGAPEAAPARPSSECLVVGYGPAAGWRCFPSHRHRILLLTSYSLPFTYIYLDLNAKRARAGAVSRARAPTDDPDPTGPWGSSVRELQPAIRPWGCEHSWHPLGYISIWPVYLNLRGVCGTPSLGSVETWH